MKKYFINYNTGAGNEWADTLWDAMALADEHSAYTQENITILDDKDNVVAERIWWGVAYDAEESVEDDVICFGSLGYYGEWQIYE